MRCEDLTRELASPTGAVAPAEMAGHLAACPACAEWSRRSGQLDRIWEATRPSEPSMDALDALWSRASLELDGAKAPATLKFKFVRPAPRRWAKVALITAQAAAILVAAVVLIHHYRSGPVEVAVATPTPEPAFLDLKVENDMLAVVRIGKDNDVKIEKVDLSPLYNTLSLPVTPHDELDAAEAAGTHWSFAAK